MPPWPNEQRRGIRGAPDPRELPRWDAREHGTRTAYNHGCRCDECRAAVNRYNVERRARLRRAPT